MDFYVIINGLLKDLKGLLDEIKQNFKRLLNEMDNNGAKTWT